MGNTELWVAEINENGLFNARQIDSGALAFYQFEAKKLAKFSTKPEEKKTDYADKALRKLKPDLVGLFNIL